MDALINIFQNENVFPNNVEKKAELKPLLFISLSIFITYPSYAMFDVDA